MFSWSERQYLLFPWADGGNLFEFWNENNAYSNRTKIAQNNIPDIVEQLMGMAKDLEALHNFKHGNADSYRHGDLKPDNILIFDRKLRLGTWKMADLGLAQYKTMNTKDRGNHRYLGLTSTAGSGTMSYMPPESAQQADTPTSRLYDIWSVGCIILQLLTWLLYGIEGIDQLAKETQSIDKQQSSYWTADYIKKKLYNIAIAPKAIELMDRMSNDLKASKALQDLLGIVKHHLLVVKLPKSATTPMPQGRANAGELYSLLKKIQEQGRQDTTYWLVEDGSKLVKHRKQLSSETLQVPQKGANHPNVLATKVSAILQIPAFRDGIMNHYS